METEEAGRERRDDGLRATAAGRFAKRGSMAAASAPKQRARRRAAEPKPSVPRSPVLRTPIERPDWAFWAGVAVLLALIVLCFVFALWIQGRP